MSTVKEITIVDPSTSTTNSRDIGAEAEFIEVSRNSSGNITDKAHQSTIENLNVTLKNIEDNKADNTKSYKHDDAVDTTIDNADRIPFYDTSASTKKNITVSNLVAKLDDTLATKTELTNGSVTKVGTATVGGALTPMYLNAGTPTAGSEAAPKNHASSATTYGVGSTTKYGHVKVDDSMSVSSTNPVQNKVVTGELNKKIPAYTTTPASWDTTPTKDSTKPVTSGGIYNVTNTLTKETTGLIDNQNVNGAVNMLPNTATTQVINGVTFTVNDDGSITANGTATGECQIFLSTILKKGTYRFSGVPKTGSYTSYWSYYQKNYVTQENDFGDGLVFYLDSEATISCVFRIKTGYTASNLIFKPMLSLASLNLSYADYVPYAKSNKELTENVANIKETIVQKVNSNASGTVYDISFSNASYPRVLVVSNYTCGTLGYWSGTLHYIPIAKNASVSVTSSNESSNGIRLTFSDNDIPTLIPLNTDASIWTITKVS